MHTCSWFSYNHMCALVLFWNPLGLLACFKIIVKTNGLFNAPYTTVVIYDVFACVICWHCVRYNKTHCNLQCVWTKPCRYVVGCDIIRELCALLFFLEVCWDSWCASNSLQQVLSFKHCLTQPLWFTQFLCRSYVDIAFDVTKSFNLQCFWTQPCTHVVGSYIIICVHFWGPLGLLVCLKLIVHMVLQLFIQNHCT